MKIIFISGKAQSGKTTTAYLMHKNLEIYGASSVIINYADLLKFICRQYLGWNGEKDEYGRELLQTVGTEIVRSRDENFWVDYVRRFIEAFRGIWEYVIIADCRFKNEVLWRNSDEDSEYIIKVERDIPDDGLTEEQRNHISEHDFDDVNESFYDYIIDNNGSLIDLDEKIMHWLASIGA